MKLVRILGCALVWSWPAFAWAQIPTVIDPVTARVEFQSADHTAIIPAGEAGAGGPAVVSYQAYLFLVAADVTTGVPLFSGPVIAKTLAAVVNATPPITYSLTFAQMGLSSAIPACTVVAPATCPAYDIVLVSIGPGALTGTARAVASESDPFSLTPLLPTRAPASPAVVRIKAS